MSQLIKHKALKGKKELAKIADMSDAALEQLVAKTSPKDLSLLLLQMLRERWPRLFRQ